MAKRNKKVFIPDEIKDYYAIYQLDKNASTKDIKKALMQKQGEIRSNMANGSLNSKEIQDKLTEAFNTIAEAVKVFKTDERRQEYDAQLAAAYEAGKIDTVAQKLAQDIYDEIEAMFLKGDYNGAIRRCMEALDNNVYDYRLYLLLAESYYALQNIPKSLECVENGLKSNPDSLPLLKAGARFSNNGKQDYDMSQKYINRMFEIDPEGSLPTAEQAYLYVTMGKSDLAYDLIDKYTEAHPGDNEFRKNCAYDLIGYSYSFYTKDPGSDAYVIASQEAYQGCLDTCNKAASIYNDEIVKNALENAKFFGNVEYNDENNENIKWMWIGAIIYLIPGIGSFMGMMEQSFVASLQAIPIILIGVGLIYSAIMLRKLSYRPYWQINKFILTGEREPKEKVFYYIGVIFGGLIKWSWKASWKIFWWFLSWI